MHLITACLFAVLLPQGDENWPTFLGAGASEVTAETLPLGWSETENVAWKAPLTGYGQSSPVIWGDHIYVTTTEGEMKDKFHVTALKLSDGSRLWQHTLDNSDKIENNIYVSRAAPTPAVDANGVYVFFESGDMVALSHEGKQLWERNLHDEYGKYQSQFGLGASLAQTDNAVYVLADHEGPAYLLAIDKQTGKNLWKTDRKSRVAWSSPAIVNVDGTPILVVSSQGTVDGYDTATGNELFSYDEIGGNSVCTPLDSGDGKFLVGAQQGQNGEDGGKAGTSNVLLQIVKENGKYSVKKLWTAEKALASFSSPVIYKGYAYWVNRTGAVMCYNLETGELNYQQRLNQPCWATPLGVGDRIYFVGQRGTTTVLQAGEEYKVLAENKLYEAEPTEAGNPFGGRTEYGVAAVNGTLLIRTGDLLYCLRKGHAE